MTDSISELAEKLVRESTSFEEIELKFSQAFKAQADASAASQASLLEENKRLREAIEKAPHGGGCNMYIYAGLANGLRTLMIDESTPCTCWKSTALSQQTEVDPSPSISEVDPWLPISEVTETDNFMLGYDPERLKGGWSPVEAVQWVGDSETDYASGKWVSAQDDRYLFDPTHLKPIGALPKPPVGGG